MEIKDRVLVIEVDKSIRNFFRTVLEANNYDVLIATTGAEGYSMVTSQCPDVVILDLGLPDMDGMTILKNVRQWSSMPVLVVSARTHEKDKVAALDAGAEDFSEEEDSFEILTSPDDLEAVRETLEAKKIPMAQAEETMIPQNYVALDDETALKNLQRTLDLLEEDDDVQAVYTNLDE